MSNIKQEIQQEMQGSIDYYNTVINKIAVLRVSASTFDDVFIDAYGSKQQLKAVSSIEIMNSLSVKFAPWDKGLVNAIDKALLNSKLGLTTNIDNSGSIIANFPPISQERRESVCNEIHAKSEDIKVSIRNIRRKHIDNIKADNKSGDISEDQMKSEISDIDKISDEFIKKVDQVKKERSKDFMTL